MLNTVPLSGQNALNSQNTFFFTTVEPHELGNHIYWLKIFISINSIIL